MNTKVRPLQSIDNVKSNKLFLEQQYQINTTK